MTAGSINPLAVIQAIRGIKLNTFLDNSISKKNNVFSIFKNTNDDFRGLGRIKVL
jgi:hypothetical protein